MNIKQKMACTLLLVMALVNSFGVRADRQSIDRYKADFNYLGIDYQILSETESTVAVAQRADIDSAKPPMRQANATYHRYGVGPNGFLMAHGLSGPVVVIPETVYDGDGKPYTVTDLAEYAINWVGIGILALPSSLRNLNGGISYVFGLSDIYLPDSLKEIDGITDCNELKNLHIPAGVEVIRKNSLHGCGLKNLYLPPAVKAFEDGVLAECDSLELVMLSEVEHLGAGCLRKCNSILWANIPETIKDMREGCFNDCDSLALVSLPWSEIDMNDCFNGCPSISQIEVLATEPYPFPQNCFLDVDRNKCSLSVPVGSEEKYRQADGWKDFYSIVGELPAVTGSKVASVRDIDFRAIGEKGSLKIVSTSSTPIEVFDLAGKKLSMVRKSGISEIALPEGIYIVASPFGSRKVTVK